ncbi:MAG: guanylate kinase [Oscillospiraceae bacterium]|jgi:guanylate kinase|nr:guanylate kinase [Oscillospiraceae bacterium]
MAGMLLVVSGPSGAGKGTVLRAVMDRRSGMFFSVSATTRPPRPGEQDGREYFFMDGKTFSELRGKGGLLEWAEYAGYFYGTPEGPVRERLARGQTVVLDIEVVGGAQVMERCPEAVSVFLTPSDERELERRLRGRGTESEETIQKRMARAREEYRFMDRYRYIVVNDALGEAVKTLEAVITAEGARAERRPEIFSQYREKTTV